MVILSTQPDNTARSYLSINKRISQLSQAQSEWTIYKVHRHLRNINDKAYEPEVIAIGPYHRDKDYLQMIEEHKLRYLHSLLLRKNENLERCISVIQPLEAKARKCYAEPISLNPSEFVEMLVLDGCFIIELVRKCSMEYLREKNDPVFHMDWIINSLQRDLMLFENQIPFFILCKLFDFIEHPNQHDRLISLFLNFFNNLYPGKVYRESTNLNSQEIKHLLHFIHNTWLPSNEKDKTKDRLAITVDEKDKTEGWWFIKSVTLLREANVKFEKTEGVSLFDIKFKNGTICLAPLTIEDRTECFLRNLIAYEQYFQDSQCNIVTNYVKFLDCLINFSRDVEILSRYGIIDNWLGDDEAVANIFNKLTDSVTGSGKQFIYAEVFDTVNIHCNKRRNKWMAKLRRNYLNSPWAVISIFVAVALLLLTVTQTVCSILQVV